ncbi:MAG: SpoIVB peptidase [Clostridiales bacterium]
MKNFNRQPWLYFTMIACFAVLIFGFSWLTANVMDGFFQQSSAKTKEFLSLEQYQNILIKDIEGEEKINETELTKTSETSKTTEKASLDVSSKSKLMVGGTSLGIIMKTDGVLVVGYSSINNENGDVCYPAKEGGIALGDSIIKIEGEVVNSDDAMLELINKYGAKGEIKFEIRHGSAITEKTVMSYFCAETERYRVGLYVRDNMGGVGTLTFYDPKSQRFGALGHPIEGVISESGETIIGRALPSAVRGIKKATKGETGEKIGYFESGEFDGVVDTVGLYGIYGIMEGTVKNPLNTYVYPGKSDEVKVGPAKIVTVIEGSNPEFFDINILHVDKNDTSGKGLAIEITDKNLLEKTGGIIQGMSGSPVLQNNKLVGAVTYVMVNQPQKGYGCLIEYMLKEGRCE